MEENNLNDESIFRGGANIDELIKNVQAQEEQIENEVQNQEIAQTNEDENINKNIEENNKENIEEAKTQIQEEKIEKPSKNIEPQFSEEDEENEEKNNPLKKYIFYVSKDFTDVIDNLTIDERTAYINDAIQMKIDSIDSSSKNDKMSKIITQAIIVFITVCIMTPVAFLIMNKALMMTFDNYKYSQQNFEKLYRQRFENDKAYMRSLQYNQMQKQNAAKKKTN